MKVRVRYREEFETTVEVSKVSDAQVAAEREGEWQASGELHPDFIQLIGEDGEEIACPNCEGQNIVDGQDNPMECLDCKHTW